MTKLLLTRSCEENLAAVAELSQLGYLISEAPMISYINLPYDFMQLPKHLIITSKHAAKIVAANATSEVEAWVVGAESAAILNTNKKIRVTGTAKNLKNLINIISLIPEDEADEFFVNTVYLSGNIITYDLPSYIKRDIIYKVIYAEKIPEEAQSVIRNREIGYITVYSKNCAMNLIKLLKAHNLLPYIRHSLVIGISEEVAALFNGICSKILHSKEPTFSEMIKIIGLENERNNSK